MSETKSPSVADLLGVGRSFEFDGKSYELREPTQVEQQRFAKGLKDRAKLDAVRTIDATEEEQQALLRAVLRDIGEGWYDVDSPGYVAGQQNPTGLAQMLHITLSRDHPEVTEEVAQRMVEKGMRDTFLQLLAAEQHDPKALEVVCLTLGFPADYLKDTASTRPSSSSDSPTRPTTGSPGTSSGSPTPSSSDSSPSSGETTAAPS